MTEGMEAVTVAGISKALELASQRQQVIATNIANVNVPGYRRVQATFGAQVDDIGAAIAARGSTDLTSLQGLSVQVGPIAGDGGEVKLDREMADMAHNAVQYQALLRALSKDYAVLALAASDGKR